MMRLFAAALIGILIIPAIGAAQNIGTPTCTISGGTITCPSGSLTPSAGITQLTGDVTAGPGSGSQAATLATAQPAVHTWALAQTFTAAPVFTNQSGTRTALGLGTAATQNTGTSGANVPLLNGANTQSGLWTMTAGEVNSTNGAVSTAAVLWSGTILTSGCTSTTCFPAVLMQPTGTTAVTSWLTTGTGLGFNLSASTVAAIDVHVAGGASVFSVSGTGTIAAGTVSSSGSVTAGAANLIGFTGRGVVTSPSAGSIQLGSTDVDTNASIVAQVFRSQGTLAGGTADQAGKNLTIIVSPSKGAAAGGSFIVQTTPAGSTGTAVNAPVTALTINSAQQSTFAGQINVAAMTQTSAAQSGTVCYNSGTGAVTYDATLGCLTSTMTEKDDWQDISPRDALAIVLKMQAGSFNYKPGRGLPRGPQIGLAAEQIATLDDRLVAHRPDGRLAGVRYSQASALYPMAIQALNDEIATLRRGAR